MTCLPPPPPIPLQCWRGADWDVHSPGLPYPAGGSRERSGHQGLRLPHEDAEDEDDPDTGTDTRLEG